MLKRLGRWTLVQDLIAWLVTAYLWLVQTTTRYTLEPADYWQRLEQEGSVIGTTWHGQHFLIHLARPRQRRFVALISRSGDGELNARIARKLGVGLIRGSGGRSNEMFRKGAVAASREVLRKLQEGTSVLMTADVPKIARKAGLGIITLAQHSGCPIYPVAVVNSHRFDLPSWDSASVAKPFGRGAIVVGTPIHVSRDLREDELEAKRKLLESELNRIHHRAYSLVGRMHPAFAEVGA